MSNPPPLLYPAPTSLGLFEMTRDVVVLAFKSFNLLAINLQLVSHFGMACIFQVVQFLLLSQELFVIDRVVFKLHLNPVQCPSIQANWDATIVKLSD